MKRLLRGTTVLSSVMIAVALGVLHASPAAADNKRLNNSVAVNVYTIQHQAGCNNDLRMNPQLQLAAQWHTDDVLNNRDLDADTGSDGTTTQDRANIQIGVWSENSLDRTVVVAVYGQPDAA